MYADRLPKRKTTHSPSELTESPAIRRKLDMTSPTLTLVPDDLDDDTHVRLDAMVYAESAEPSNPFLAAGLLATIVHHSEQKLSPRFQDFFNAKDLLAQDPELMEMLKVAWAKKSFKEIRRLSAFLVVPTQFD